MNILGKTLRCKVVSILAFLTDFSKSWAFSRCMNYSTSFAFVWWSTFRLLLAILFLFSLLAEIYYVVCHSCLHNHHSWILRLSISFDVLKIPTLCTYQWLSEDLIRFLATTFLARCRRISHRRFCRELSSHTTHQIRTCSFSYATQ